MSDLEDCADSLDELSAILGAALGTCSLPEVHRLTVRAVRAGLGLLVAALERGVVEPVPPAELPALTGGSVLVDEPAVDAGAMILHGLAVVRRARRQAARLGTDQPGAPELVRFLDGLRAYLVELLADTEEHGLASIPIGICGVSSPPLIGR
ncbi:hypothetical protein ACL02T_06350 [Pseudonocardia sp. RS010]|uniref:hypothetical protein n=1 Tax=Pseudonocardia sp. RS010 TaxID=3385979 RepID=UPI0039A22D54